ncbi:MAG TPA: TolC family protein [Pyrinomonadaceae bacterium]|nr:TolC family protein [Pyrinomonadaceae bacterium]
MFTSVTKNNSPLVKAAFLLAFGLGLMSISTRAQVPPTTAPPTTVPTTPITPPINPAQPPATTQPAANPVTRGTNNTTTTNTTGIPTGNAVPAAPGQNVGDSGSVPPSDLPTEPPPVAPNFEAPIRPLPSAERVGVDMMNQLSLSLDDAVKMALQNNNDIDSSKITVQIAEFNLRAARGVYDPAITSQTYYESRTTPTASTIGGAGSSGSVTQKNFFGDVGVEGFSPFAGGIYNSSFTSGRNSTNNQNSLLNPQFPTALTFGYVQPLWRGLRFDLQRRNIEIAKKNLSLTDAQFRQRVIDVISQVEQSYWDLVFALRNLQVQIDAVKQARLQLESNQRLVAGGVLAPIEIVAANSQITTFEQNVYTAQESITLAENALKTLILKERTSDIWFRSLTPVTPVEIEAPRVPLEIAVGEALKNRPELQQLQANSEVNDINTRYFRDQTKPQIDLFANYTSNGLAGTANDITRTNANSVNPDLLARINQLSATQNLPPLVVQPTTSVSSPPQNLVGGYFNSLSSLFSQKYPTYQVGVRLSLPLGNRVAAANLGSSLAQGSQIANQRAQAEQIVEADVRNTTQSLRSAEARLQSAAASRASSEQLFESEQRQFRAGTSTVFLVFQRQTELLAARSRELQAQTDLNKAISNFRRATGNTLNVNNIDVK